VIELGRTDSSRPVFVVEDDGDICALIQHHLQSAGYEVRAFLTGASIIARALEESPRLFVLDIMLPGMDGFELCRQIRQSRELVARVSTVLRAAPELFPPRVLKVGDLEIDCSSMTVTVEGKSVVTTVREFRLLEYLATHQARVFTRDQLLAAVWKESVSVTLRSVDVYVRRLREKIERDPGNPQYLKTFRGMGYRFDKPR
jgi:DNA-binding response OmpR family regulator